MTGYDIKLPMQIEKSNLDVITDSNNKMLSAYDVARYVYEKTKDKDIFRKMHSDFFYMFEMKERNIDYNKDDFER